MGTDHAGNKKWTGLKGPVGMLFSPRATKRGVVIPGSRKTEESVVENFSGVTSSTEADESPQSGKPNKVGRLPRQEDDVTLTPGGHATGKAKRRQSGAMNLLRKAMFTQNNKDDNSIITEASRDIRGRSDSFGIDPLFDDELTSSKQSSVKPPSCSDLSSSEAYSSRTDLSGFSAKVPPLKKGNEKQSDEISQRPPRPGDRVVGPALPNDRNAASNNDQNTQSGNKTTKGGQGATNADTGSNPQPRSPRPMQTGVRSTLVSKLINPSASQDGGTMDASFHPTLSQKLLIGKQEIEKKMEVRKKPLIDPLKLAPSTKSQDRKADVAKVGTKDKTSTGSTTAKSTGTRRKSTTSSSDAARREYAAKETSELNPESPQRPTTPTVLHHPSDRSKVSSRHRRPHHSHEKTEERRRHNSDGTSRSRGRSGPRHSYDQSPKTPAGSHHSTKDRKYSHHRAKRDEASTELPKISNLDGSPSRTRHGSTKSPSRENYKDRKQVDAKRHGRSQDAHHHASRPDERRMVEEKKRSKSFDESMSRDKSVQQGQPDLIEHHDKDETERSRSSGHHRIRDHSSPHSRESHRTRTEKSPTSVERKRSKSMDDSQSRSKSPHQQSRRSSYSSQNRSRSSGHRGQRGESSPHSRESHRKRTERRLTTPERKRSKSMDDSQSRSKSPHQQSRRQSYGSRQRNDNKEEETVHSRSRSRESVNHNDLQSPTFSVRKRSLSLDESRSHSRGSQNLAGSDNLTTEQEDKVSTMNELWNELTRYGPPHLKRQEHERSQMIVSKAEKQRRGEIEETSRRNAPGHHSQSPGRRSTNHDDDGTVASGGTVSRRQTRRERREKGEDASSSRASRPSTSPSHRSTSSSHRQVPRTPSGRSERSTTRSTSREKWEKILHPKDTKTEVSNPVEPPFPTATSNNEAESKLRPVPTTDESEVNASTSLQTDMETLTQEGADNGSQAPSASNTTGHTSSSKPPAVANSQSEETFDKIPPSTILTESHYRAVNKMADRNFHSPLGDPPGVYSPTQRQANGRRVLLASSTAPKEGMATPLEEENGNTTTATTNQKDDKTKDKDKDHDNNSSDVLVSTSTGSRAATLKNHLRQLEQLHGSGVISSNRSRSEPPSSSHTHRSSGASRYSRRPRPTEDRNGGVHDSGTSGTSGISKAPSTTSSSTGISRSRQARSDSLDHTNRRRNHHHHVIAHSDNSPGHGSQSLITVNNHNNNANNESGIKPPTKDLGRFLKSPKPDKNSGEETKSKQAAKTIMSLESVPVSESTTES